MAQNRDQSAYSAQGIAALLYLLCMARGTEGLCYWNPITNVRTCTSWGWPGSSAPPAAPPSNFRPPGRPYGPGFYRPTQSSTPPTTAPTYPPTLAPTPVPTPAPTEAPYTDVTHPNVPPTPQPTRGCFGDMPFGLENCVCDGAEIGEAAGLAACSSVFSQCAGGLFAFNAPHDRQVRAIEKACDSLTASSCVLTGKQIATMNPTCAALLEGAGSCSPDEAKAILTASVERTCEPLCPDCTAPLVKTASQAHHTTSARFNDGGSHSSFPLNNDYAPAIDPLPTPRDARDSGDGDRNAGGVNSGHVTNDDHQLVNQKHDDTHTLKVVEDGEQYSQPEANQVVIEYPVDGAEITLEVGEDDAMYEKHFGQGGQQPENKFTIEAVERGPSVSPSSEEKGCFGGLPFGLEQCACDGASIGEAAGMAGCSALFSECQVMAPFAWTDDRAGEAVQRACDDLAQSSCLDTAPQFALQTEPCAKLLFEGNAVCSVERARAIFRGHVDHVCAPLCPGCARRP